MATNLDNEIIQQTIFIRGFGVLGFWGFRVLRG